eukprot:COSAG02_NODE_2732_length_8141_cov_41.736011_4_plen_230_part_00
MCVSNLSSPLHIRTMIVYRENGGGCGLARALGHISNSLSFQRFGHQMVAQSAAGMMWPGLQGMTNGDYQIKYIADRIVKAPYWYAQLMLAESHQPNVVGGFHLVFQNSTVDGIAGSGHVRQQPNFADGEGVGAFVDWMGAASDDGRTLVLRFQNPNSLPVALNVSVANGPWTSVVAVRTLSGPSVAAVNDFDNPCAICPMNSTAIISPSGQLASTLVPLSFTVMTLHKR